MVLGTVSFASQPADARCLDDLADCLSKVCESKTLDYNLLGAEFVEYGDLLLREAYSVINNNLKRTIDTVDLHTNLNEVREYLCIELDIKHAKGLRRLFDKKQSLTQQMPIKDRDLMINALIRLLRLEDSDPKLYPKTACNGQTTSDLILNNRIAMDPIGRRLSGKKNFNKYFDRIATMVFHASVEKARYCIEENRNKLLRRFIGMPDDEEVMRDYWDRIFQHRFKKEFHRSLNIDASFKNYPKQILEYVRNMPHGVETDEIAIALDVFKEAAGKKAFRMTEQTNRSAVDDFQRYLHIPCTNFITMTTGIYQSLDFDMKLRDLLDRNLVKATDTDDEVNRQRAYLMMCKKLVDEKKYFVEFYELHSRKTQVTPVQAQ